MVRPSRNNLKQLQHCKRQNKVSYSHENILKWIQIAWQFRQAWPSPRLWQCQQPFQCTIEAALCQSFVKTYKLPPPPLPPSNKRGLPMNRQDSFRSWPTNKNNELYECEGTLLGYYNNKSNIQHKKATLHSNIPTLIHFQKKKKADDGTPKASQKLIESNHEKYSIVPLSHEFNIIFILYISVNCWCECCIEIWIMQLYSLGFIL